MIEAAGGIEVFPQLAARKNAKDRIVSRDDIIAAQPDIIIGSWCGKNSCRPRSRPDPALTRFPPVATGWLRRSNQR